MDSEAAKSLLSASELEIPANPISEQNTSNSATFSPIKFSSTPPNLIEEVDNNFRVIDEDINFKGVARKISECGLGQQQQLSSSGVAESSNSNLKLQRKSDEDICNTPKRERNQDQTQNIRFARLKEAEEEREILVKTPPPLQPTSQSHLVKSLSVEFEQRLASIQVSPKPNTTDTNNNNNNTPTASNTNNLNSNPLKATPRSMSPIRCVAQLSPVGRLNLNDKEVNEDEGGNSNNTNSNNNNNNTNNFTIETPKLVSPSKIVAANSSADIEKIKTEIESKWSKQVEFLQFEINSLEEKYESSIKNNSEMRAMIEEYEKTLAQFIDARRSRPDQHSSLDQLLQDKKKLELEIKTLQISYQNLHQRYEDLRGLQEQARINDATLRQSIQLLQQELATTVRTLDNTRRAYEDKLEKVNSESKNVKETLEYELSATKAKLLKSELKITSLESAIEAKTKENSELMTICDELIHKMDKRGA